MTGGDDGDRAQDDVAADAVTPTSRRASSRQPRSPIEKATDLGSVQVLKHGNLYLLTDQFGDIHPDSRGLGLYRRRHAAAVVLRAARRRRAAGRAPGVDRRELPRARSS